MLTIIPLLNIYAHMYSISNLHAWAQDKPLVVAIVSQQLAVSAELCYKFLNLIKRGERPEGYYKLPPVKKWLRLYKNRQGLQLKLIANFKEFGELAEFFAEYFESIIEVQKHIRQVGKERFNREIKEFYSELSLNERIEFSQEINEVIKNLYELNLEDIKSDVDNVVDEDIKNKFLTSLTTPEMQFFYKVITPCWLIYAEHPTKLLKRARSRDFDSLVKLIRIDRTIVNDPFISEYIHQLSHQKDKTKIKALDKAIYSGINTKLTLKRVKMSLAGLISKISDLMGKRLMEPDIRQLFDAVSKDLGHGDIDIDLPDSPEAFTKSIQRNRLFWEDFFKLDKK